MPTSSLIRAVCLAIVAAIACTRADEDSVQPPTPSTADAAAHDLPTPPSEKPLRWGDPEVLLTDGANWLRAHTLGPIVRKGGKTRRTGDELDAQDLAVNRALTFLRDSQLSDGSFPALPGQGPGVAATVLVAFQLCGPGRQLRQVTGRCRDYLWATQSADGWLGPRDSDHAYFNQVRGALLLSEMATTKGAGPPAQRAIRALREDRHVRNWWQPPVSSESWWLAYVTQESDRVPGCREWRAEFERDARRLVDAAEPLPPEAHDAAVHVLVSRGEGSALSQGREGMTSRPDWTSGSVHPDAVDRSGVLAWHRRGEFRPWVDAVTTHLVAEQTVVSTSDAVHGYWQMPNAQNGRGVVYDTAMHVIVLRLGVRYGRMISGAPVGGLR